MGCEGMFNKQQYLAQNYYYQYLRNPEQQNPYYRQHFTEFENRFHQFQDRGLTAAQIVSRNGNFFLLLDTASQADPAVQLAAVKQSGYAVCFIENPSPEIISAAIRQRSAVIKAVENPSEDDSIWAIQHSTPAFFKHVRNRTERVVLAYLEHCKRFFLGTCEFQTYFLKICAERYNYYPNPEKDKYIRLDYMRRNLRISKKCFTPKVQATVGNDPFFRQLIPSRYWTI